MGDWVSSRTWSMSHRSKRLPNRGGERNARARQVTRRFVCIRPCRQALAAVVFSAPDGSASSAPADASQATLSLAGVAGTPAPELAVAGAPGNSTLPGGAYSASPGSARLGGGPGAYGVLPGTAAGDTLASQAGGAQQQTATMQGLPSGLAAGPRPLTFTIQTSE